MTIEMCPICFLDNEDFITTECNHKFHKKCLELWSLTRKQEFLIITCPLCRKEINKETSQVEDFDNSRSYLFNLLSFIGFLVSVFFQLKLEFELNIFLLFFLIFIHLIVHSSINFVKSQLLFFVVILNVVSQMFVISTCIVLLIQMIITIHFFLTTRF